MPEPKKYLTPKYQTPEYKYTIPITPDSISARRQREMEDAFLSAPKDEITQDAELMFGRGNIHPEYNFYPVYSPTANYHRKHPNEVLYRVPLHQDFDSAEAINPDLSNLRASDQVSPVNPKYDQDGAMMDNRIGRSGIPAKSNLNKIGAAKSAFATESMLNSIFDNIEDVIMSDNYLQGYYDYLPNVYDGRSINERALRKILRRDGEVLRSLRGQYGNLEDAFAAAMESRMITNSTANVLQAVIGNTGIPIKRRGLTENPSKRQNAIATKYFNTLREAHALYTTDPNSPEKSAANAVYASDIYDGGPYKYAGGVRDNIIGDSDYKQVPYEYAKYSQLAPSLQTRYIPEPPQESKKYSRGGRLRTAPKTLRDRYGHRLGRAEGLGNDDYDVYF